MSHVAPEMSETHISITKTTPDKMNLLIDHKNHFKEKNKKASRIKSG